MEQSMIGCDGMGHLNPVSTQRPFLQLRYNRVFTELHNLVTRTLDSPRLSWIVSLLSSPSDVDVVVVVVVVLEGAALHELLVVHVFVLILLAVAHTVVNHAVVDAGLLVISVVVVPIAVVAVVVSIVVVVVSLVLASVLAGLLLDLTVVLLRLQLGIADGLDELTHLHNVLAASWARVARTGWAQAELGKHARAKSFILLEFRDGGASVELHGVLGDPVVILVVIVIVQSTGLRHEALTSRRVGVEGCGCLELA
mmetsp:Transcript_22471/g.62696  ORF Transcript_22471/g.62696 Transcript_22471/m.62696 type:complete len:254 (+) Transcript_22471:795-1556(+)